MKPGRTNLVSATTAGGARTCKKPLRSIGSNSIFARKIRGLALGRVSRAPVHERFDEPQVVLHCLVGDDKAVTEVLLKPVVELLVAKAGEGRGGAEADLVRLLQTGGEEEIAGTVPEGLQHRGEVRIDGWCRHGRAPDLIG
ncbi:hypothetical protein THIOKS11570029 [Thiocapsa sp. KS1]|nr:hypothetical protein THIOKS11570029 [Thiocapsa sp. KS1]